MPRPRMSPNELRQTSVGRLGAEEQLDREAASILARLLEPVAVELAAPHECFVADCTDSFTQLDLAHDVDTSEDTISYVLSGRLWPNLQLLLTMLSSLDHRVVGHRRADA